MQEVFDNNYVTIYISEEYSMIKFVWKVVSENMKDEEFQEIGRVQLEIIHEYKPIRNFSDTRHFAYVISNEMQQWFSTNVITPAVNLSIKKLATLVSPDIFAQLSIEFLIQENPNLDLTTRYFKNEEEAWDWILKA